MRQTKTLRVENKYALLCVVTCEVEVNAERRILPPTSNFGKEHLPQIQPSS
jgi:hypothetical protein